MILALFKVCFCNFFPNIEKVKIIIMTRVSKERTPSYKMADVLDSWVDLAKECSPVRCDDNIDHMIITNPPVIKQVVNNTNPSVTKLVVNITNPPVIKRVITSRLPPPFGELPDYLAMLREAQGETSCR